MTPGDAWTGAAIVLDESACPECGRESCEEHIPPTAQQTVDFPSNDSGPVVEDRLTEAGAAERFARKHGGDVRFDHRRNRWLLWQGHRWVPDADAAVTRLAHEFARTWQREALDLVDRDKREAAIKFALRLERRDLLGNVLWFARAFHPVTDAGDSWDDDPWLLGVANGVVDLRTGRLRAGRREDRLTMSTAVGFDADAPCVRWERFIGEIFAGDSELAGFVQRAVGYSLTGATTEQVLFLCYGTGANGKGTFANTLQQVLGDYGYTMPFSTVELRDRSAIPNDLAALVNRRFVTASETSDGARLNEARVKALTGCDPITARFLHAEFFTFTPNAKFWLSVNHKPVVRDDSFGFWRRIRLVPFTQTFTVNAGLATQLRDEAPGILAWAVRGALEWQRVGLQPPATVTAATDTYRTESDPLAAFLAEACELSPEAQIGATDLLAAYNAWADAHGLNKHERLSTTHFGRKAGERFVKDRDSRTGRVLYRGLCRRGVA